MGLQVCPTRPGNMPPFFYTFHLKSFAFLFLRTLGMFWGSSKFFFLIYWDDHKGLLSWRTTLKDFLMLSSCISWGNQFYYLYPLLDLLCYSLSSAGMSKIVLWFFIFIFYQIGQESSITLLNYFLLTQKTSYNTGIVFIAV